MLRIFLLAALVYSVSAGVLAPAAVIAAPAVVAAPASYAAGPALGAPLLGRVTYTAPEVNVVKQPITIDQPEIRYRAVPTLVQPTVVHHAAAVVHHAAPVVHHAAPVVYAAHQPALTIAHQPALTLAHHHQIVHHQPFATAIVA